MPPLTYIHASEAARTTAGGRGIGGSVSVTLDKSSLTLTAGESATVTCTISGGMEIGFAT